MKNKFFTFYGAAIQRKTCLKPEETDNYLAGKLHGDDLRRVEWHLSECPFCSDALDAFAENRRRTVVQISRDLLPQKQENTQRLFFKNMLSFGNIAAVFLIFMTVALIWLLSPIDDTKLKETALQAPAPTAEAEGKAVYTAESPSEYVESAPESPVPVSSESAVKINADKAADKPALLLPVEKHDEAEIPLKTESAKEEFSNLASGDAVDDVAEIIAPESAGKVSEISSGVEISKPRDENGKSDADLSAKKEKKSTRAVSANLNGEAKDAGVQTLDNIQAMISAGKSSDAEKVLKKWLKNNPDSAKSVRVMWLQAQVFFVEKKTDKAKNFLEKIILEKNGLEKEADSLLQKCR
jgi:hypothetical protein